MNRTELELRMESLKKQQKLTSKAIEDTQKQLDDLDIEENLKETQEILKKFLKFKGKIIIYQCATWGTYILKVKDIVPQKSKYRCRLSFVAEGNLYRYDGTAGKENLEICDSNTLLVSIEHDTLEKFSLMKNWNFWNRRPVLKIIKAAEEIKALIEECGMDTTIDYDDKPIKTKEKNTQWKQ